MNTAATLLAAVLREPATATGLDADQWTGLLTAARAEQLIASLALVLEDEQVPLEAARKVLKSGRHAVEQGRVQALWEVEMCRRALAPLGIPVVLLKGSAYIAADLQAGEGRFVGDLDILVPRERLADVEHALLGAGWEWVKDDPYDHLYYRKWMHELPPLIHRDRDRMIDVHHTILPPTAQRKPDAAALIADSVARPDGLRVLSPPDMIVHAAAHLFADGDLAGGLRNLWDIDRLLRQFGQQEGFWRRLAEHARLHDLEAAVSRSLRLSGALYGTPIGWSDHRGLSFADRVFLRRLCARDHWGRQTRKLTRFAFYIRSHWIRMPPLLLARHLWIKSRG
ncbi:MAG: nucleotidyltransferase family protein [Sphingomonadaceae bacterium]